MSNTLDPTTKLSTEAKRALLARLLRERNGTPGPPDPWAHRLFEAQASRTSDAIAVLSGEQSLTYRELDARANQLAHHLRRLGVGPETRVALCVERSPEMVVGLLGILKAGGAYVPLDPDYPAERLAFMLDDARAAVLLTQGRLRRTLPASEAEVVCLDVDWEAIARASKRSPAVQVVPENLAYVIYTSGSTGRPKGVPVTHAALANFLRAMRQQLGMTDRDTLLAVTTLSFDIAALELFLPLTVGARLVLVSRDVAADGARLSERLEGSGATFLQATPATWRLLLEAGWPGSPSLTMLCGGEALPRELADRLLAPWREPLEPLRPDRDDHLVGDGQGRSRDRAGLDRPADRQHADVRARRPVCGRSRSACPASCTSAASGWRAAT